MMLLASGCGQKKPVVNTVKPNKGLIGTEFKISGNYFEKTQLKSTVTIGAKKCPVTTWSMTSIEGAVPLTLKAGGYPVVVKTAGGTSNKITYTVYATFTGSTPLPAMLEFLKNRKIETSGIKFNVVATSKSDPDWKVDTGVAEDGTTYYFLFHRTKDGWTIKDYGTSRLTGEQMQFVGAPGDLKIP